MAPKYLIKKHSVLNSQINYQCDCSPDFPLASGEWPLLQRALSPVPAAYGSIGSSWHSHPALHLCLNVQQDAHFLLCLMCLPLYASPLHGEKRFFIAVLLVSGTQQARSRCCGRSEHSWKRIQPCDFSCLTWCDFNLIAHISMSSAKWQISTSWTIKVWWKNETEIQTTAKITQASIPPIYWTLLCTGYCAHKDMYYVIWSSQLLCGKGIAVLRSWEKMLKGHRQILLKRELLLIWETIIMLAILSFPINTYKMS